MNGLPEHVEAFATTPATGLDTLELWLLMVTATMTGIFAVRICYWFKRNVYHFFDKLWPETPKTTALAIVDKKDVEKHNRD